MTIDLFRRRFPVQERVTVLVENGSKWKGRRKVGLARGVRRL